MSTKISALPPSTGLVLTDIFPVVDDPGGVPVTEKATFTQLATLFSASFAPVGSGVTSFNARTGAVTLLLADVSAVADARYVLKTGDTMTGALLIGNGSLVANTPALSLSQTWNNAAVTFTNLFSNVTNTASNSNSNLFNFQIDGVDRFNFTTAGIFRVITQNANDSGVSVFLRKRGATGDVNGAVANGGNIGTLTFSGWDGSAFQTGATINTDVDGTWSGTNRGLSFRFQVTATGTTANINALSISGGVAGISLQRAVIFKYVAKTATYTITEADYTVDCTANSFTVNLPTAVGITGRVHVIKNSGAGTITIDPSGAQTIDSLATATVVSGASITTQSNGANWIII